MPTKNGMRWIIFDDSCQILRGKEPLQLNEAPEWNTHILRYDAARMDNKFGNLNKSTSSNNSIINDLKLLDG